MGEIAEVSNIKRRWGYNDSFGLKGQGKTLILFKTTVLVEHFSIYVTFNKIYSKYNYGFMRYTDPCPHCRPVIVSVL